MRTSFSNIGGGGRPLSLAIIVDPFLLLFRLDISDFTFQGSRQARKEKLSSLFCIVVYYCK